MDPEKRRSAVPVSVFGCEGRSDDMISTSVYVNIIIMTALCIVLPIIAAVVWLKKTKERISSVIAGAATWFVFAIILESIPKAVLFNPSLSIGKTIMGNAVLYTFFGALLAGIFEETGRLIVFRTILKNRTNKEAAVSHGIGHGGFEAVFLMGMIGIQYLVYASMINAGTFGQLVEQTAAMGADVSALEKIPEQIMAITPAYAVLNLIERAFAMLLHTGLSIIVFHAVKKHRTGLYFLAVALHALFDVPAVLYQLGIIKEPYIVEIFLTVYALIFFAAVYKLLYKADNNTNVRGYDRGGKKTDTLTAE